MRFNVLIGGEAGLGPNLLTEILGRVLVERGYYVFYSRDYQSLIRGGHNFNVLTFSEEPVNSNDSKVDILVCLDAKTEEIHQKNLNISAVILKGSKENMYYAGRLFKMLCLDFSILDRELKKLGKRYEENLKNAKQGYEEEKKEVCKILDKKKKNYFMNGNKGISEGAKKSGIEIYYAYPMTPATPVLGELAENQLKENRLVVELENEIAVANAGVGSCIAGKKVMVGTSGGGFDLMTETLSLCGIAEIPLVFYLSMRPGPGTGVATYTAQGDLNIARHAGHGEFPRVVLAPGDPEESIELTNSSFYFSHKFKVPSIIVSDKHLGESWYCFKEMPKLEKIKVETKLSRFNSYEVDKEGSATEDAEQINKNILKRKEKYLEIKKEAEKFEMFKTYGNKNSKNVVVSWGSPKGAILDAIKDLNICFVQVLYIEPFSEKIEDLIKDKNIILVENSATGLIGDLIKEKTGIKIKEENKILRFDGRPFFADELKKEIEEKMR